MRPISRVVAPELILAGFDSFRLRLRGRGGSDGGLRRCRFLARSWFVHRRESPVEQYVVIIGGRSRCRTLHRGSQLARRAGSDRRRRLRGRGPDGGDGGFDGWRGGGGGLRGCEGLFRGGR